MNTDLGTIYKLCRFWTWRDSVTIPKEEMIRLDADNYIAVIDSTKIGRGTIKVQTTVQISDTDCPGGIRTEIYTEDTGIKIA